MAIRCTSCCAATCTTFCLSLRLEPHQYSAITVSPLIFSNHHAPWLDLSVHTSSMLWSLNTVVRPPVLYRLQCQMSGWLITTGDMPNWSAHLNTVWTFWAGHRSTFPVGHGSPLLESFDEEP